MSIDKKAQYDTRSQNSSTIDSKAVKTKLKTAFDTLFSATEILNNSEILLPPNLREVNELLLFLETVQSELMIEMKKRGFDNLSRETRVGIKSSLSKINTLMTKCNQALQILSVASNAEAIDISKTEFKPNKEFKIPNTSVIILLILILFFGYDSQTHALELVEFFPNEINNSQSFDSEELADFLDILKQTVVRIEHLISEHSVIADTDTKTIPQNKETEETPNTNEHNSTSEGLGIILRDSEGNIVNAELNPEVTISITRYNPEINGGEEMLDAYQVLDQNTSEPLIHPVSNSFLYIRGGERIGIEAMNFDYVYDQDGRLVGLADDVEGQAVIRNYHTHPPTNDFHGAIVLFDQEYQQSPQPGAVIEILQQDFNFYDWMNKEDFFNTQSDEYLRIRRVYVVKTQQRWGDNIINDYRVIALTTLNDDGGVVRSFHYDTNYYWWNLFHQAQEYIQNES
jgi:hypothetical protein